jgi:hypothetical protein
MEKIIVKWYNHSTNKTGETELSAYGLTEAIDIVRRANDFQVVCLGAEYKDIKAFIKSIQELNGESQITE